MSQCSVVEGEFEMVQGHRMVTINIVHIFHHNSSHFQWNTCCVRGPVKPADPWWEPKTRFWTASGWFKKGDRSVTICITPFEKWKVVISDDWGIEITIAEDFRNGLKSQRVIFGQFKDRFSKLETPTNIIFLTARLILPYWTRSLVCCSPGPRNWGPWRHQVLKVLKLSFIGI